MQGPFPPGHWEEYAGRVGLPMPKVHRWSPHSPKMMKLKRGRSYRVARRFVDVDGDTHQKGEEWEFIMATFDIDSGLFRLFVRSPYNDEWEITLNSMEMFLADAGYIVEIRNTCKDLWKTALLELFKRWQ